MITLLGRRFDSCDVEGTMVEASAHRAAETEERWCHRRPRTEPLRFKVTTDNGTEYELDTDETGAPMFALDETGCTITWPVRIRTPTG